ncbi:5-formyltetrahydrofolate cyclo-ligase [Streptomyces sodiiphilus]|uniref:5-formyltetrahydrofolate cyclo-ligase n=1 Tax=Streptomyces sodiiphilus TaxID=226217 RepID=A0ABP5ALD2_9ACTN
MDDDDIRIEKRRLRRDLLAVRAAMADDELRQAADALAEHTLTLPELAAARTVAAYVSVGHEPGTGPLLEALRERGVRVILPVLLPDDDLDWGPYEGGGGLVEADPQARVPLLEPSGGRLGPQAVAGADVVLMPGLAVDRRGVRMGRGGGSYDRALARLSASGASPALLVLLYGHEVVEELPEEPHDHPVHAAVTPDGVHRFPG